MPPIIEAHRVVKLTYLVDKEWYNPNEFGQSCHDKLRSFLARLELLGSQLLYRGFDIRRLRIVEETGNDRDASSQRYSGSEVEYLQPEQYLNATPLLGDKRCNLDWAVNRAFFEEANALSIYRAEGLVRVGQSLLLYIPKTSFLDALVTVVVPEKVTRQGSLPQVRAVQ